MQPEVQSECPATVDNGHLTYARHNSPAINFGEDEVCSFLEAKEKNSRRRAFISSSILVRDRNVDALVKESFN